MLSCQFCTSRSPFPHFCSNILSSFSYTSRFASSVLLAETDSLACTASCVVILSAMVAGMASVGSPDKSSDPLSCIWLIFSAAMLFTSYPKQLDTLPQSEPAIDINIANASNFFHFLLCFIILSPRQFFVANSYATILL